MHLTLHRTQQPFPMTNDGTCLQIEPPRRRSNGVSNWLIASLPSHRRSSTFASSGHSSIYPHYEETLIMTELRSRTRELRSPGGQSYDRQSPDGGRPVPRCERPDPATLRSPLLLRTMVKQSRLLAVSSIQCLLLAMKPVFHSKAERATTRSCPSVPYSRVNCVGWQSSDVRLMETFHARRLRCVADLLGRDGPNDPVHNLRVRSRRPTHYDPPSNRQNVICRVSCQVPTEPSLLAPGAP